MIGHKLREARQQRRLSMKQVAEKADLSLATLSRIENNKQPVDTDLLLELARILKADPIELLGVREQPKDESPASIVRRILALDANERMVLWKELAKASNTGGARAKRSIGDVEQLLAQLEFIRREIARVTGSLLK